MAAIVWDDVVAIAPELASVPVAAQTMILAYVNEVLKPSEWGGEDSPILKLARVYLAAHYGHAALFGGNGPAGPVTSESAGEISRSYGWFGSGSNTSSDMGTTAYGRAYLTMLARTPARAARAL